ncbi:MAG: cell wall hydrolase [Sphingopyxis sp.]
MSRIFQAASMAAIAATAIVAAVVTVPGLAQSAPVPLNSPAAVSAQLTPGDVVFEPAISAEVPVSADGFPITPPSTPDIADAPAPIAIPATGNLATRVNAMDHREPEDAELRCLAAGVFFESKGELLEGQLAVAHVIINRANSGRFARSYCGVLTQPNQFSFVRGGVVPRAPSNAQWRTAVAVARIARDGDLASPAPGAMFFHATRVTPGWNRPRVARLGNHVFYR